MEKKLNKNDLHVLRIFCALFLSSCHFGAISKQISVTFSFIVFLCYNVVQSNINV